MCAIAEPLNGEGEKSQEWKFCLTTTKSESYFGHELEWGSLLQTALTWDEAKTWNLIWQFISNTWGYK